jgi:DNA-binding NarL/FixJ family response regulator
MPGASTEAEEHTAAPRQTRTGRPAPIRLVILSAVRLVHEGVAGSFDPVIGVRVVEHTEISSEAFPRIGQLRPDAVLVDVTTRKGLQVPRRIHQFCPQAALIAFAVAEVEEEVIACANAGFCGYVSRQCGASDLLQALYDSLDGRLCCPPHISSALFRRLAHHRETPAPQTPLDCAVLTPRETEIITLADTGQTNKEIARELRISDSTVKNHMHNILQKLMVSRRGEALSRLRSRPIV